MYRNGTLSAVKIYRKDCSSNTVVVATVPNKKYLHKEYWSWYYKLYRKEELTYEKLNERILTNEEVHEHKVLEGTSKKIEENYKKFILCWRLNRGEIIHRRTFVETTHIVAQGYYDTNINKEWWDLLDDENKHKCSQAIYNSEHLQKIISEVLFKNHYE